MLSKGKEKGKSYSVLSVLDFNSRFDGNGLLGLERADGRGLASRLRAGAGLQESLASCTF